MTNTKQDQSANQQSNDSRESKMVVLARDHNGKPTIWCDPEIVPLVKALNDGGVATIASCSGHGERNGNIMLKDGRELIIANDWADARRIEKAINTPAPQKQSNDPTNTSDELDAVLEQIAMTSGFYLDSDFQEIHPEAKAAITTLIAKEAEKAVIAYRDQASTDCRPLSAEPLIIEQPVPCTSCGDTHYADWTLWPHQMYNKYSNGGVGHYCFPCFAGLVKATTTHRKEDV